MYKLNQTNAKRTIVCRVALLLAATFTPAIPQAEEVKTVPNQVAEITTFKLVSSATIGASYEARTRMGNAGNASSTVDWQPAVIA